MNDEADRIREAQLVTMLKSDPEFAKSFRHGDARGPHVDH
jgi:hypothetical protein